MKYFFDCNIARRIVEALKVLFQEESIVHLDERFPSDAPDSVWIPAIAADPGDTIVVGADYRILKNRREQEALRSAQLTYFVFNNGWVNQPFHDQAWRLVKVFPDIVASAQAVDVPTVFSIPAKTLKLTAISSTVTLGLKPTGTSVQARKATRKARRQDWAKKQNN